MDLDLTPDRAADWYINPELGFRNKCFTQISSVQDTAKKFLSGVLDTAKPAKLDGPKAQQCPGHRLAAITGVLYTAKPCFGHC